MMMFIRVLNQVRTGWSPAKCLRAAVCLGLAVTATAEPAVARAPEYAKLQARLGLGVEVQGTLDQQGFLVAADIEALDQPRSPKLRGEITAVDLAGGTITMFGLQIGVSARTEMEGTTIDRLKPGQRAEVKCRITQETGIWIARSISTVAVKASDKVKGTITAMSYDGVAPDTLSLDGLQVLLVEQTDLAAALMQQDLRQADLFGRLAAADADAMSRGHAVADGHLGLRVQYRQYYQQEQGLDLTSNYESDLRDTRPELKVRGFGYLNQDLRAMVDLRWRRQYVLHSDLAQPNGDPEFLLRQAYVLWRNIAGSGFAIAAGRQKIKDDRQWLWDEYLEAVRIYSYGLARFSLQATYIKPVEPLKEKFATWEDLYLAADWHLDADNTFTCYMLRRWDSDRTRGREPVWSGLRYRGSPTGATDAWLDLAAMRGADKGVAVRAWAFDLGTTWSVPGLPWGSRLTAAYAFGSGDQHASPARDGEFRQTGYQDNTARFGGVTAIQYYGAVLDPELSNLAITTLGGGLRPHPSLSVDLLYHHYQQDWAENDLRGALVDPPARPNGQDTDLGWGIDLVVGTRNLWGAVKASWTVGLFTPGAAYAPRQERALLNKLNVTVEI